ncbi:MAG: hypothetical protein ACLFOY_00185 [Desulfatibacillaceae bacterium]
MRLKKWIPWRFFIRRTARRYGLVDPVNWLAKVRSFAQPSEVAEPFELVRAAILFHARGIINTQAIQHNMDWIWPYWVERQFNPADESFIPRAYSLSHINLTHRNWTAVGLPEVPLYPLVDPRGLVTPLYDGWSLDFWVVPEEGTPLIPSRQKTVEQKWLFEPNMAVVTTMEQDGLELELRVELSVRTGVPWLDIEATASGDSPGWLVASLRPYNPEGIQFVDEVSYDQGATGWVINKETRIRFSREPDKTAFSTYAEGDVFHGIFESRQQYGAKCSVGMATAAALFPLSGKNGPTVTLSVNLEKEMKLETGTAVASPRTWEHAMEGVARLEVPDDRFAFVYDAARHNLALLSAGDTVPGTYTYRRFWFRDACIMVHCMLLANMTAGAQRQIDSFFRRQKRDGYFESQEGEWDSNGQVLWVAGRYAELAGVTVPPHWLDGLRKGAAWIEAKRVPDPSDERVKGLLPPGFSAEHFGPNDNYYWDDFWAVAGLRQAARTVGEHNLRKDRENFLKWADDLERSIYKSIATIPPERGHGGIPASPRRRMDAGAIGCLVADYPLHLVPPREERITNTARFLLDHCFYKGAFFQDMTHSGLNAYLTLAVAQTLLRNGDPRSRDLVRTVVGIASPTGQWPEAIHPRTGGGCMGDGQHGWAAAEMVAMVRNMFVREEGQTLILGSGVLPEWIEKTGQKASFGPTPTPYGPVSVSFTAKGDGIEAVVDANWRDAAPRCEFRLPGHKRRVLPGDGNTLTLEKR